MERVFWITQVGLMRSHGPSQWKRREAGEAVSEAEWGLKMPHCCLKMQEGTVHQGRHIASRSWKSQEVGSPLEPPEGTSGLQNWKIIAVFFFKPLSLWLFGTAVRANMCNHNENTVPNFKNTIINYCLTIFNWPMLPILNSVLFVLQYVSVQALIHHHHNIKKK